MRLCTRQQYRRMMHKATKFIGKWILVDIRMTQNLLSRLGITVTKRYGHSPQRNRFKRLIREAFRLSSPTLNFKFDVVIRPRSQALHATLQDIQFELCYFIEQANSTTKG